MVKFNHWENIKEWPQVHLVAAVWKAWTTTSFWNAIKVPFLGEGLEQKPATVDSQPSAKVLWLDAVQI